MALTPSKSLVTDDDSGVSDSGRFKVTVNDVPPQLINVVGSTINENGVATITAKIEDPGVNDTFSIDVNWQDGSATDHITGLGASDSSGTVGTNQLPVDRCHPPDQAVLINTSTTARAPATARPATPITWRSPSPTTSPRAPAPPPTSSSTICLQC